jgi:NADH-quinone oxidoreductase subunit G
MSISAESSVGVNTYVLHKKNKIFRIVPRENVHVNGLWMPDSARTEHGQCSCEKRLVKITQNGRRISIGAAISQIIKSALGNKLFVVCSGNMSLEDQFVLRRLLDVIVSTTFLLKKSIRGDGFLISDDGTPNFNGATLNSITANENIVNDLLTLDRAIKGRECKKILAINEDIFANGVSVNAASGVDIFYIGTEMNATAKAASVIIPMATFFEYTGTFINRDWRLQKFHKAVNPPNANIFPLWYIFSLLLNSYIGTKSDTMLWLDGVWQEMSKTIQALESIDFLNINPAGIELKFR